MKNIYILLLFLFTYTTLKSQVILETPHSGAQTYDTAAPEYVRMKNNFEYKPEGANYFRAYIDPYMITPPTGGETGGPGGIIGNDGIVGATEGSITATEIGNLIYSIPIKCIPGIAGMQPSLSLSYSNSGPDGIMGPGWSLNGISEIVRTREKKGYGNHPDEFDSFVLDGVRLIGNGNMFGETSTNNTRKFKKEREDFSEITMFIPDNLFAKSYFEVRTKSGLIYTYGGTLDSKRTTSNYNKPISYLLSKIEDLNGNAIIFSYTKDELIGECYPIRIDYTINTSKLIDNGDYSIEFSYETRNNKLVNRFWSRNSMTDPPISIEYSVAHRLKDIVIKSNGTAIRKYQLEYLARGPVDQPEFQNLFLESIQEIGMDGIKYNKTVFQHEPEPSAINYAEVTTTVKTTVNDYYIDLNSEGGKELVTHDPVNKTLSIHEIFNNNNHYSLTSDYTFSSADVHENISFGDFNGDGMNDIIQWYRDNNILKFDIWESTSDYNSFSFIKREAVLTTPEINQYFVPYFGEFNGDGKTDIMLRSYWEGSGTTCYFYFYWNSDHAFHEHYPSELPNGDNFSSFDIDKYYTLLQADLNGDGRTDYFCHKKEQNSYTPTKQGFLMVYPNYQNNNVVNIDVISDSLPDVIADFNGDGKSDILYSNITEEGLIFADKAVCHLKVYQSTGIKLITPEIESTFDIELPTSNNLYVTYGCSKIVFQAGELNLDGHADLLATYTINKYESYYHSFYKKNTVTLTSNVSGNKFALYPASYNPLNETTESNLFRLDDLNGDGKSDFITSYILDASNKKVQLNIYTAIDGNKINSITNGLGVETKISYIRLTDNRYDTDRGEWPIMSCNMPLSLVSSISTDNGFGGMDGTAYSFSHLRLHPQNGILGFLRTVQSNSISNIRTETRKKIVEFGNPSFYYELNRKLYVLLADSTIGSFQNGPVYTVLSRSNYVYDIKTFSDYSSYYALYLKVQTDKLYETNGLSTKVTQTTNDQMDVYGNFGSITTKQGISLSSMPYQEITTSIYDNYTDNGKWILGRLKQAEVVKKSPGHPDITRKSAFTYYEGNGQIKTEVVEPDDLTKNVTKTYEYDDFGNIKKTIINTPGKEDRITTTSYDHNLDSKHGRFLTNMVNAMDQSSVKEIDPLTGNTKSNTDLNGLKTTYEYDGFGTKIKTVLPDKTQAIATARWCDASDTDKPALAVYYIWSGSSAQMPVKKYYNKLGTELRTVTYGFDGKKIYNDIAYDSEGRQWKSFLPYYADQPPTGIKFTETKYDKINRIEEVINPVSSPIQTTTYTYEGLKTSVTNPNGQTTSKTCNAAGWVIKSTDAKSHSVINEFYSDGKVAKKYIEGKPETTITMEYDRYGNLSKMIDPDLGTINYTYTGFGELETETNNKNQTTVYKYDNLGRVRIRTDEKETTWVYDVSAHGVGMVSSISIGIGTPHGPGNDHVVIYTYDNLSRASQVDEIIDNTTYTTATTYDIYGRPDQIVYPSTNYTIKNHYNEFGFFDKVIQANDNKVLWQAKAYNEKGQLLQSTSGANLTTFKEYNPLNGSLTAIRTGTLQNFEYDFDAIGNLNWRKDIKRSMKEGFIYDNLNRLTHVNWNDAATAKLTMEYDDIGNITYKSDVGYYTYNLTKLHKLESINHKPLTISDFDQNIIYTCFDKVSDIWLNDGTEQTRSQLHLTYGVDRQRVKQVISKNGVTSTRIYVGGLYEKFTEGGITEEIHYISGGDGLIAIYTKKNTGSSLTYVLKDHLGSIQLLVNEDNTVEQELSYDPWGLRRDPATWNYLATAPGSNFNRGFTGHEHLDIFSLINMNGRMYDPVIGYFTSPDPVLQFADFTQGLNRYAYCLNNPLSMIDPTGHNAWSIIVPFATIAVGAAIVALCPLLAPAAVALLSGAAAGFTGSLLSSIANGCSFQETLVNVFFGTIIGACSAVVSCGIGDLFTFTPEPLAGGGFSTDPCPLMRYFGRASAHGIKGGLFSFVQGGKFEQGFFSGMASSLTAPLSEAKSFGARVTFGAVVGGTIEEIGGGKFANGAVTGSFTVLYNEMLHRISTPVPNLAPNDLEKYGGSYCSYEEANDIASALAQEKGHEVSVVTGYNQTTSEFCFFIPPSEKNGVDFSIWNENKFFPSGYKLVAENHWSYDKSGNGTFQMGSLGDLNLAKEYMIPITHHAIGYGSWYFFPRQNLLGRREVSWFCSPVSQDKSFIRNLPLR